MAAQISSVDSSRQRALAALDAASARLSPAARAIFVREPLVDEHCPDTADVDLLVFGDVDDILPERLLFGDADATASADLIWLPAASLDDAAEFAARGVLPHRLLSSRLVHDRDGWGGRQAREVAAHMFAPAVQGRRVAGLLGLGYRTVREIGITWDFPELALFWLHMAWAACVAAVADAARVLCPNVYTRPLDYAVPLERLTGIRLASALVPALRLAVDPATLVPALRRLQTRVCERYPEPAWPAAAQGSTRFEYRYFGSAQELEFRIQAAAEMSRRGQASGGVFYLRLLAYALSRIPSVHADSARGETPSFLRPPRAVRPELESLCPEIVADLTSILAGPPPLGAAGVKHALDPLLAVRAQAVDFIRSRCAVLPELRDWAPFVKDNIA